MGGKLDIYNLGETGVDVVKSPLHEADGDLFQAQNAHADPAGEEGGIRKRDGMAKVNAGALTGAIEGATNVTLQGLSTRTLYAGIAYDVITPPAYSWYSSTSGTSWSSRTTPGFGATPANLFPTACVSYKHRMYYAGYVAAGGDAMVRTWDGTRDSELLRVPLEGSSHSDVIGHMWFHRGVLYLLAGSSVVQHVYRCDIVTGAIQLVATASFTGRSGLSYLDRIWVFGESGGTGQVQFLRNGEAAFTADHNMAAPHVGSHGAAYKGDLYVGTYATAGTAAIVEKRTASTAAWSTSTTGGSSASANYWTCFAVFNNLLFCVYVMNPTVLQVWKYDGSSWTLDYNIISAGHDPAGPGGVLVESDALYIAFEDNGVLGYVLRRSLAGSWSKPLPGLDGGNGMIGLVA